jgi:hypothetical protein
VAAYSYRDGFSFPAQHGTVDRAGGSVDRAGGSVDTSDGVSEGEPAPG